jgi:hypothetical protein
VIQLLQPKAAHNRLVFLGRADHAPDELNFDFSVSHWSFSAYL